MLMCIQNLVKLCPLVLKILSGNEMVMELQINGIMQGQGKYCIAPLLKSESGAINNFTLRFTWLLQLFAHLAELHSKIILYKEWFHF